VSDLKVSFSFLGRNYLHPSRLKLATAL